MLKWWRMQSHAMDELSCFARETWDSHSVTDGYKGSISVSHSFTPDEIFWPPESKIVTSGYITCVIVQLQPPVPLATYPGYVVFPPRPSGTGYEKWVCEHEDRISALSYVNSIDDVVCNGATTFRLGPWLIGVAFGSAMNQDFSWNDVMGEWGCTGAVMNVSQMPAFPKLIDSEGGVSWCGEPYPTLVEVIW